MKARYVIVRSTYLHVFEKYVMEKMEEGYQPIGGVSVSQDSTRSVVYHQAMVLV